MKRLPFLRLQECIELALDAKLKREEAKWKQAAFIGWQHYLTTPVKKGAKHMGFKKWLQMTGIEKAPEPEEMTIKEEVVLVGRLRRMARKAFGGG